ncbi:MAG: HNH endonuclease [Bacteroidetes bacterium]|nr:HNH endonuclease [Bacteroidota bacterium]
MWIDRDPERFWSKVEKLPSGCWIWHGTIMPSNGAAMYNVTSRRLVKAHRIAWEETRGPLPEGARLLRTCKTQRCISPEHRLVLVPKDYE